MILFVNPLARFPEQFVLFWSLVLDQNENWRRYSVQIAVIEYRKNSESLGVAGIGAVYGGELARVVV